MELHTIGIDLGKTVFHLVGLNLHGEVVVRKRFSRTQLLRFTANVHVGLIGMEACGGAHFLGRALREQRHEVRLIPAQYVKPYVKTNKSDYLDAEAIAEAVARPTMRFVPIKTDDQLDMQSLHRVRERWVMRRTAVINQIRGLLLERGITLRKGRCHVGAALPGILEDADAKLSGALRGWGGFINYDAMAVALRRGYATGATDDGHIGAGASFVVGHPEKLIDFAYRAEHEMTIEAKTLIKAFHGRDAILTGTVAPAADAKACCKPTATPTSSTASLPATRRTSGATLGRSGSPFKPSKTPTDISRLKNTQ
jgi:hypothetical protein